MSASVAEKCHPAESEGPSLPAVVTLTLAIGTLYLGLFPRAGPGRALSLALTSKLMNKAPKHPCVRAAEKAALIQMVKCSGPQAYIVVVGNKGLGKSTMIKDAFSHRSGVINVDIDHAMDHNAVQREVLNAVTANRMDIWPPHLSAHSVLFFHRIFGFIFRLPPALCVLTVHERRANQKTADMVGAIRILRETYGLAVVVDAAPNSIPDQLLTTGCQRVLTIGPMTKDMILELPQLKDLVIALQEAGLLETAWQVLGGIPREWDHFADILRLLKNKPSTDALGNFLTDAVTDAILLVQKYRLSNSHMENVLAAIHNSPSTSIPYYKMREILQETGNAMPSPDSVLSVEITAKEIIVTPATAAIKMVLKHDLKVCPSVEQLKNLCNKDGKQT